MNINVYDDFFSKEIHENIWNLMQRPKWSYTGGRTGSRFWHMEGLEQEEYFNTFLFNIICKKLNKKFEIERIYANGQTGGQSGNPHKDGYYNNKFTFLYYPNPYWELSWGGHLNFIDSKQNDSPKETSKTNHTNPYKTNPEDEILKVITYKPNRALIFPGNIFHYAEAPCKYFNHLRVSLAYKLKL